MKLTQTTSRRIAGTAITSIKAAVHCRVAIMSSRRRKSQKANATDALMDGVAPALAGVQKKSFVL